MPLAREAGAVPLGRRNRKRTIRYDKKHHRARHLIDDAFCRLKDFRRVHTGYDKLAANFIILMTRTYKETNTTLRSKC